MGLQFRGNEWQVEQGRYHLIESPAFKRLQKTLQANYSEHDRIYAQLVRAFNECSLPLVNEGFVGTSGELPPLSVESLKDQAQRQRLYHVHLGQLLARRLERLRDIRVALRPEAEDLAALPVVELRRRFFDPVSEGILEQGDFVKAAKLYAAVAEIEAEFGKRRVGIVFSRPLDNDLGTCVDHLIANAESIDAIEIWNNRFRREGYADNARFLESLRLSLNRGDAEAVEKLLASGRKDDAAKAESSLNAALANDPANKRALSLLRDLKTLQGKSGGFSLGLADQAVLDQATRSFAGRQYNQARDQLSQLLSDPNKRTREVLKLDNDLKTLGY